MTDDKAFTYYKDYLQKEFKKEAKLSIVIQPCEYYKNLLRESESTDKIIQQEPIETEIDLDDIREKINDAFTEFTRVYADGKWQYRFTINKAIDKTQALWTINNIETKRKEFILSKYISVTDLFSDDYTIIDRFYIPIKAIDNIVDIKKYLENNFREGLEPFYIEFANRINRCVGLVFNDEDLPF